MSNATRQFWMSVLARADEDELARHWQALSVKPEATDVRTPETGLAMVRGRAGGTGEPFNLGEMTISRCAVRLDNGLTGFGYVKGRSRRHARLAALFDALLQDQARHPELMQQCITPLHEKWLQQRSAGHQDIAATRVDFFTMVRGED